MIMTDINKLIDLNIELEGLLRVLVVRNSDEAKTMLAEKFAAYAAMMDNILAQPVPVPEEAPATEAAPPMPSQPAPKKHGNTLAKALTLNDKFRYTREVFAGNERDFNDTVAILADMDSFDEAREYLLGDMMLDPKAPAVAEFLELVKANIDA